MEKDLGKDTKNIGKIHPEEGAGQAQPHDATSVSAYSGIATGTDRSPGIINPTTPPPGVLSQVTAKHVPDVPAVSGAQEISPFAFSSLTMPFEKRLDHQDEIVTRSKETRNRKEGEMWEREWRLLSGDLKEQFGAKCTEGAIQAYKEAIYTKYKIPYETSPYDWYRDKALPPEEFWVKYMAEMARDHALHAFYERETDGLGTSYLNGGFANGFLNGAGKHGQIWNARLHPVEGKSLLTHAFEKEVLPDVMQSGVFGAYGMAGFSLAKDVVVLNRPYVAVFRAGDLSAAGYPLLNVNEDPRDAGLLNEVIVDLPVDISLALGIFPIEDIPGHEKGVSHGIVKETFGQEWIDALKVKISR